jgi:hypothetical protein
LNVRCAVLPAFWIWLSLGILAGCGSGPDLLGSCQLPASTTPGSLCEDYHGLKSAHGAAEGDCIDPSGTNGMWKEGIACDHRGSLGGCLVLHGDYDTTVWFFAGSPVSLQSSDDVRRLCGSLFMGQYVSP